MVILHAETEMLLGRARGVVFASPNMPRHGGQFTLVA